MKEKEERLKLMDREWRHRWIFASFISAYHVRHLLSQCFPFIFSWFWIFFRTDPSTHFFSLFTPFFFLLCMNGTHKNLGRTNAERQEDRQEEAALLGILCHPIKKQTAKKTNKRNATIVENDGRIKCYVYMIPQHRRQDPWVGYTRQSKGNIDGHPHRVPYNVRQTNTSRFFP